MAQAVTIWHNGAVSGQPAIVPNGPSLSDNLNTSFSATYSASKSSRLSVVGATDIAPYVVALDTITKVRFLALRVLNGPSIKLKLTSPAGADQAQSGTFFLWHSPNSGDEITAIKLVGTADIEIMIAGDTT